MDIKEFKSFLLKLKDEHNTSLIETVIKGYSHLFEANTEEDTPEDESASKDVSTNVETAIETSPEIPKKAEETPEKVEVSKPAETEISNKKPNQTLIDNLNGDLLREYAAAIQYIQHAAVVKGSQYMHIMKELLVHADEEIGHAKVISDRINYLGGIPTVDVGLIKISANVTEMLNQDKTGEEEAIQRYQERIKEAEELKDFGTKQLLIDVLTKEEEHRNDLMIALGQ